MITKNDLLVLLKDISDNGVDTSEYIKEIVSKTAISPKVLTFINEQRPLDVTNFYEKLRKSYNAKKSTLYKNIVTIDEAAPCDVLTTLGALLQQVLLFRKTVEDDQLFLKSARFTEISACLYNYSKTFDLIPCIKLLTYIRADLKAFEEISRKKSQNTNY